jgi:signal transduction histidine kinase
MRVKAPERPIKLLVAPGLPLVRADADKLRRAVQNLIDNAIKYSPSDSTIAVRVQAVEREMRIAVHDEGIGVPKEEQEHIFERFHRVDTSLSRTTPGVGLGLYIVKAIIDAHGGRAWVESPGAGQGSTFIISLPFEAGSLSPRARGLQLDRKA